MHPLHNDAPQKYKKCTRFNWLVVADDWKHVKSTFCPLSFSTADDRDQTLNSQESIKLELGWTERVHTNTAWEYTSLYGLVWEFPEKHLHIYIKKVYKHWVTFIYGKSNKYSVWILCAYTVWIDTFPTYKAHTYTGVSFSFIAIVHDNLLLVRKSGECAEKSCEWRHTNKYHRLMLVIDRHHQYRYSRKQQNRSGAIPIQRSCFYTIPIFKKWLIVVGGNMLKISVDRKAIYPHSLFSHLSIQPTIHVLFLCVDVSIYL